MADDSSGLDRSLVRGIAWTGGVKWLTQFVSWGVTLVVARLLTPADYGLVGMALVYIGLAQIASENGLLPVVIEPKSLGADVAARLGGLALMVGVAICALSAGVSPLVAWFFKEERVQLVIVVLSTSFLLKGAQVLPRGLLARDLDFRRLAWIDGAESLSGSAATVIMALAGFRYWSLVGGSLFGNVVSTVLCLTARRHRVTFPRDFASIRTHVTLGGHVIGSQLAWYVYSDADFAVVGRILGRAALGVYSLAWTIANVPVDRVTSMVGRVTAPIFSKLRGDRAALRRYVYSLTEGLALVTTPACVGLALVADVLVHAMLVPAWEGVIVPLRLLSLYAAFRCVTAMLSQVLIFTGRARRNMEFSILAAAILPLCFVIGTQWGTAGVAGVWATVFPAVIGSCYVHATLKLIGMPFRSYARSLVPAVTGTAIMAAALTGLRLALPASLPAVALLIILVAVGGAVYAGYVLMFHGQRLRLVLGMLKGRTERLSGPTLALAADLDAARPRLLLVSWHFPPDPAVGALRWRKLARYAVERGWAVDVIMRDTRALTGRDEAGLADLPRGVRVHEVPDRPDWTNGIVGAAARLLRRFSSGLGSGRYGLSPSQQSLHRSEVGRPRGARDLVRAWYAWREHRMGRRWAAEAARIGRRIIEPGVHRAIVSCGPPHFVHLAALSLGRETGLPFAIDLRDPWSLLQRFPEATASPLALALAARDERRVVGRAGLVVCNTEPCRDRMAACYRDASERIIAVPNGFDDDPVPPRRHDGRFVVAYAGTIYLDRDPRPLFRAVRRLASEGVITPADLTVEFMGDVSSLDGVGLEDLARAEGVEAFVRRHPAGSRAAAREFLARASVLAVLPQDSDLAIPAKVFEYMAFDAWILALADVSSATGSLLRGLDADVVPPEDVEGIARRLRRRLAQHARGERATRLAAHPHLGRRARAETLIGALEAITGAPDGAAAGPDARATATRAGGRRRGPRSWPAEPATAREP